MEDNEALFIRIEDKIKMLGDQLMAKNAEIVTLHEEIKNLKDKIAGQEVHRAEDTQRPVNIDQINAIKSELTGYMDEVKECIQMVENL